MSIEDTSGIPSMISRQDVLARPGWTAGRIEKLLGGPDEIEAVHARRRDYLIYFYSAEHVRHVEATPEFVIARDKLEARRAARARAAQEQQLAEQRRILAEAERTDVLAALFTLNRTAKRYREERLYDAMEEIYAKKGQVIAHMLAAGRLTATDTHRIGGVYAEVVVGEGYRFHRPCAPPEETAGIKEIGDRIEAKPREGHEPDLAVARKCVEIWLAGKDVLSVYAWPRRKKTCFNCGGEDHLRRNCPKGPSDVYEND